MSNLNLVAPGDISIHPVTGRIGAEIRGVRLSADLQPDAVRVINAALLKHKVIFFRAQGHLDDRHQEAFGKLLGEPVAHPTVPVLEGTQSVLELDSLHGGRANSWHTDVTFVDAYPKISILRGVVNPEVGGDTVWANAASAYDDLPQTLQHLADELWAVHSNEYDYAAFKAGWDGPSAEEAAKRYREVFVSTRYETEHPLVRVHPETGEKTLVLGHFFKHFVGYKPAASQHLFEVFQGYITRLENLVRWRWTAGDVAIWDNRATQHYAVNDYGDARRIVHRVTLAGEVPVSVGGRKSVTLSAVKNPLAAAA